ncbi:hypothetical protein [Aquimarina spongiae]|uniref:Uncharacterized protein n=1 Tax=Aquimarina spongiae TaxID=570521 RepID=A0A1M6ABF6_9FLAO|nr:hypothetical protein [Aquimarina spongiae]SHI33779.1 hypothetical protein SAMN04488508_101203 [Aquimarina spongiae]
MQVHQTQKYTLNSELNFIVYGKDTEHKHPNNAALLDADGKMIYSIEAPFFKSDQMINGVKNEEYSTPEREVWVIHPHKEKVKNFWGKVIDEKPMMGYIDRCNGMKHMEGKEYAEIVISDGAMYFELQYLDIKTGVFTEHVKWGGRY